MIIIHKIQHYTQELDPLLFLMRSAQDGHFSLLTAAAASKTNPVSVCVDDWFKEKMTKIYNFSLKYYCPIFNLYKPPHFKSLKFFSEITNNLVWSLTKIELFIIAFQSFTCRIIRVQSFLSYVEMVPKIWIYCQLIFVLLLLPLVVVHFSFCDEKDDAICIEAIT